LTKCQLISHRVLPTWVKRSRTPHHATPSRSAPFHCCPSRAGPTPATPRRADPPHPTPHHIGAIPSRGSPHSARAGVVPSPSPPAPQARWPPERRHRGRSHPIWWLEGRPAPRMAARSRPMECARSGGGRAAHRANRPGPSPGHSPQITHQRAPHQPAASGGKGWDGVAHGLAHGPLCPPTHHHRIAHRMGGHPVTDMRFVHEQGGGGP
jgi:hypothetical protein